MAATRVNYEYLRKLSSDRLLRVLDLVLQDQPYRDRDLADAIIDEMEARGFNLLNPEILEDRA